MTDYLSMSIDLIFGFIALFIVTKVLGKTSMSQITPFDFVSAVLLGELVGNALFDKKAGVPEIAFVVALFGILMWLSEKITQKFKRTRALIEGSPSVVIHKGKLYRDSLKKNNLDLDQLQHLLRVKDVFTLQEVEFAILEANGELSVLKKSDYQTPTRKDMKLSPKEVNLPAALINDGELIEDNLREKNLTKEWVMEQINAQGFDRIEDVFYAEYEKGEDLLIYPFLNRNHTKWDG
ncbi:YetF domain-containing protein [Oceanobacillus caeni]|uniref:YetF domain-containing protein n=1 Tax=Oceanobacillus caeni TaxID=405946 RepID=UPI0019577FBC